MAAIAVLEGATSQPEGVIARPPSTMDLFVNMRPFFALLRHAQGSGFAIPWDQIKFLAAAQPWLLGPIAP